MAANGDNAERDFGNHLGPSETHESALQKIRTAGSISISPELFEKLCLTPQTRVEGNLRKILGNPTPLAITGFVTSLTPLSCDLMGWRGAGGDGSSDIGAYYFFGGILMLVGGLLEFILGKTFPFVVSMSFEFGTITGSFYLTFGSTLQPFYIAYGNYDPTDPSAGLKTPAFNASFGVFFVFFAILCFYYLILSLIQTMCTTSLKVFPGAPKFGYLRSKIFIWSLMLVEELREKIVFGRW